jgi:hypothetical protein
MSLLSAIGRRTVTDPNTNKTTIEVMSPEAAREQIAKLSGDKSFQDALRDTKNQAKREEALKIWEAAWAAAYPAAEGAPAPTPTPAPKPTPGNAATGREAAQARIRELTADSAFQGRMRDTSNSEAREAAVQEWSRLHEEAYAPDDSA